MGRSTPFDGFCAEQLATAEGLKCMRRMLKHWKRKGGEGGAPGNYDKFFEKLNSICNDGDDEEVTNLLTQMLEGTDDDDWNEFYPHYSNLDDEKRNDFMNTLNIIKWIDGPFMGKEDVTLD